MDNANNDTMIKMLNQLAVVHDELSRRRSIIRLAHAIGDVADIAIAAIGQDGASKLDDLAKRQFVAKEVRMSGKYPWHELDEIGGSFVMPRGNLTPEEFFRVRSSISSNATTRFGTGRIMTKTISSGLLVKRIS